MMLAAAAQAITVKNTLPAAADGDGAGDASGSTVHLFCAQMAGECPLGDYGTNSMVVRATSAHGPAGPFEWSEDIILPFAHNPTIRALPNDEG